MSYRDIDVWYSRIFRRVVTGIDDQSDLPVPWFTHNIWRDLQWTGYVGQCQDIQECLSFGLNLEKTKTWLIVSPRVADPRFQALLSSLENIEWRWHGRPIQHMNKPAFDGGGPYDVRPADEVNIEEWLRDLGDIIEGRRTWSGPGKLHGKLIRPHLQLMRRVGAASTDQDANDVEENMRRVMSDLRPMVSYLTGGRR